MIRDENRVRSMLTDSAKRNSMELHPLAASGARSRSAGPDTSARRKSSLEPKENKSDDEQRLSSQREKSLILQRAAEGDPSGHRAQSLR